MENRTYLLFLGIGRQINKFKASHLLHKIGSEKESLIERMGDLKLIASGVEIAQECLVVLCVGGSCKILLEAHSLGVDHIHFKPGLAVVLRQTPKAHQPTQCKTSPHWLARNPRRC